MDWFTAAEGKRTNEYQVHTQIEKKTLKLYRIIQKINAF